MPFRAMNNHNFTVHGPAGHVKNSTSGNVKVAYASTLRAFYQGSVRPMEAHGITTIPLNAFILEISKDCVIEGHCIHIQPRNQNHSFPFVSEYT